MTASPWVIRDAAAGDGEFMADMLVAVVNWSPRWKARSRRRVLSAPATGRYIAGWPRGTDLGVIAGAGGAPIGAAWLRFFAPDGRGYGYVAPDVPELTIGVVASWRGRGAGRALLRAVAARATSAGIARISLSVERANFARDLYLSEGYQVTGSGGPQADTMVKVLAAGCAPAPPRCGRSVPLVRWRRWPGPDRLVVMPGVLEELALVGCVARGADAEVQRASRLRGFVVAADVCGPGGSARAAGPRPVL